MELLEKYICHPVGQGFFYSGFINTYSHGVSNKFKFIFDFGSHTRGTDDVFLSYIEYLNNNLDLLVISHFDIDHFNKINLLKGVNIKRVILPFMSISQKILCISQLSYNNYYNEDFDEDFYSFVMYPEKYLSDNGIVSSDTNIFFIRESIYDAYPEFNIESTDGVIDVDDSSVESRNILSLVTNSSVRKSVLDLLFIRDIPEAIDNVTFDDICSTIHDIFNCIYSMSGSVESFDEWILEYVSHGNISKTKIKKIYKQACDELGISRSRAKYLLDMNNTCLSMVHVNRCIPVEYSVNSFLSSDSVYYNNIEYKLSYIKNIKDSIRVVQIPHHGSRKNSNKDFFKYFTSSKYFFVNYGIGNSYGHPTSSVMGNVSCASSNKTVNIFHVNQDNGLSMSTCINYYPLGPVVFDFNKDYVKYINEMFYSGFYVV